MKEGFACVVGRACVLQTPVHVNRRLSGALIHPPFCLATGGSYVGCWCQEGLQSVLLGSDNVRRRCHHLWSGALLVYAQM